MQKLLGLLLLFLAVPVQAAKDMCALSIQGESTLAEIAPSVLQADIEAGRSEKDSLKAIQHFQNHNYYMKHPDLPSPKTISRCAPPNLYQQLSEETAKVVSSLSNNYQSNRWFLSADESRNPGLLQLLLLSNQYDRFLNQAESFLLSAKDDPEAPQLFKRVQYLVSKRKEFLAEMQKSLNNDSYSYGFGLLDIEKQGLEFLSEAPVKINALRQIHIDYLLDKESKLFSKIKQNPPPENMPVVFNPDAVESLTYLKRAIKVSIEEQQPQIRTHAEARGDDLVSNNRHQEAIPYFELALAEEKLVKSQEIADANAKSLTEKTMQEAEKKIESMMKIEKQSKEFESETDALAEELGIDLDNF